MPPRRSARLARGTDDTAAPSEAPVWRTGLTDLPNEIRSAVVGFLMLEKDEDDAAIALRSLARLDRRWRAVTAPIFYESINLNHLVDGRNDAHLDRLSAALPGLGCFVKSILFQSHRLSAREGHSSRDTKALRMVDSIRDWRGRLVLEALSTRSMNSLSEALQAAPRSFFDLSLGATHARRVTADDVTFTTHLLGLNVVALTLSSIMLERDDDDEDSPSGLLDTLCSMPSLRALSLERCGFLPSQAQSTLAFPNLQVLAVKLRDGSGQAATVLNDLLVRCSSTLQILHLIGCWLAQPIMALAVAQRLSYIVLGSRWWKNAAGLRALRFCPARYIWPHGEMVSDDMPVFFDTLEGLMNQNAIFWPRLSRLVHTITTSPDVKEQAAARVLSWRNVTTGRSRPPNLLRHVVHWALTQADLDGIL